MAGTTVRIKDETHAKLRRLAEEGHESMQEVLAKAVELYRRERFVQEANAAYAALKANPKAWQEELEERALWETTLMDGLEEYPYDFGPDERRGLAG